jgi:nucleotide-binding universal stress UspA family protein
MYSKILFATDLTTSSIPICEKAVTIAKAFSAELYLLHVIDLPTTVQYAHALGFAELDSPDNEDAKIVLNTLAEQFQIPKENQLIAAGNPKTKVLEVAQEVACDLLIIGHHDPEQSHTLLGNTAQSIVKHAGIDVLTLHKSE